MAHGCTAKGNDQVRIDVSARCLDPSITVLGPAREWDMTRRSCSTTWTARGIDLPLTKKNPYSIDENLWGRAIECGELEDPWAAAPSEAFQFTIDPDKAPDEAQEVVVGFEAGIPVSLDGKKLGPHRTGGDHRPDRRQHGFGRIDMVENRLVGIKSREVYEEAGSLSLIMAHRELEDLTLTRELQHFKTGIDQRLSELIYDGLWFSPLATCAARVHRGEPGARQRRRAAALLQGLLPAGRTAFPNSLYDGSLATYGSGDTFSHQSAVGFIQLWGLPLEVWARKNPASLERQPTASGGTAKPWGGRFETEQAPLFERLSASIPFDNVLAPYDIRGSQAHVRMLASIGVLTGEERDQILAGLDRFSGRWTTGRSRGRSPTRTSTWPSSGGSPS